MEIRKSNIADINQIMELYADARKFMAENGNPTQWGTAYPPQNIIEQDISQHNSYVCIDNGNIVGTFFFKEGEDPTYITIKEGAWKYNTPYAVVHRITAAKNTHGVGAFCLNWALSQYPHIRIDTHRNNHPMQRLLSKLGFEYCGIIYTEKCDERVAFERVK